jgi:hypothetical protein
MDRTEYLAAYKRISVEIRRRAEALERITGPVRPSGGDIVIPATATAEFFRLLGDIRQLSEDLDHLVRTWPGMAPAIPGE